jgi:ubiquinone/menaquinone biosynthesis C-methylase UbiE
MTTLVGDAYDRWSETYDHDVNATRDLDARVLRQQPLAREGARILELGCGTGKNTEWLLQGAAALTALDLSEGMLRKAQRRISAPHVRFVRHDLREGWPVEEGSQDLVVGNLVLEHLDKLGPIYGEARRVLRPGGQLFLCELHPFRQHQGAGAQFQPSDSSAVERVPAFVHTVAEYLNEGVRAELRLQQVGEWKEAGAPPETHPRLFSTLWTRPA